MTAETNYLGPALAGLIALCSCSRHFYLFSNLGSKRSCGNEEVLACWSCENWGESKKSSRLGCTKLFRSYENTFYYTSARYLGIRVLNPGDGGSPGMDQDPTQEVVQTTPSLQKAG